MKKYTLTIEINVSENWIADGFNPTTQAWKNTIQEAIESTMPYAHGNEFQVTIKAVKSPTFTLDEIEELGLNTRN